MNNKCETLFIQAFDLVVVYFPCRAGLVRELSFSLKGLLSAGVSLFILLFSSLCVHVYLPLPFSSDLVFLFTIMKLMSFSSLLYLSSRVFIFDIFVSEKE